MTVCISLTCYLFDVRDAAVFLLGHFFTNKSRGIQKGYNAGPTEAKIYINICMYVPAIHISALWDKITGPLLSVTPCSLSKGETLSLGLTSGRATAMPLEKTQFLQSSHHINTHSFVRSCLVKDIFCVNTILPGKLRPLGVYGVFIPECSLFVVQEGNSRRRAKWETQRIKRNDT